MEKNMSKLRPCKISSINSRVEGNLGITRLYFSKPKVWGFRGLGLRGLIRETLLPTQFGKLALRIP